MRFSDETAYIHLLSQSQLDSHIGVRHLVNLLTTLKDAT